MDPPLHFVKADFSAIISGRRGGFGGGLGFGSCNDLKFLGPTNLRGGGFLGAA